MSVLWAYEQLVRVGVNAEGARGGRGGIGEGAVFDCQRKFGGNYMQAHISPTISPTPAYSLLLT